MKKAELVKKCKWINPNGWYAGEAVRCFNRDNRKTKKQIEAAEREYLSWYEETHGKKFEHINQASTDTNEMEGFAPFTFKDARPKYWEKLVKKLNKAKMQWRITNSNLIDSLNCVSGYAFHTK
jgi:hypothetical protein